MRNALTTMVGMAFLAVAACSSSKSGDGGTTGAEDGGDGGGLPAGALCSADSQCDSTVCGITGTGRCCLATCQVGSPGDECSVPNGCDDGGRCTYPVMGSTCETTCASDMLSQKTCDGAGGCSNPVKTACPQNFGCGATACNTSCDGGGCAEGFYCTNQNPPCQPTIPPGGPCSHDEDCSSGVCADGGVCCKYACPHDKYPECVATACAAGPDAGACIYPTNTTICDTANESCSGSTVTAGTCDGTGNCDLGSTACPNHLACDAADVGCLKGGCQGNDANCATGYYCYTDINNISTCVARIADGGCTANDQCLSGICGSNQPHGKLLHRCQVQQRGRHLWGDRLRWHHRALPVPGRRNALRRAKTDPRELQGRCRQRHADEPHHLRRRGKLPAPPILPQRIALHSPAMEPPRATRSAPTTRQPVAVRRAISASCRRLSAAHQSSATHSVWMRRSARMRLAAERGLKPARPSPTRWDSSIPPSSRTW